MHSYSQESIFSHSLKCLKMCDMTHIWRHLTRKKNVIHIWRDIWHDGDMWRKNTWVFKSLTHLERLRFHVRQFHIWVMSKYMSHAPICESCFHIWVMFPLNDWDTSWTIETSEQMCDMTHIWRHLTRVRCVTWLIYGDMTRIWRYDSYIDTWVFKNLTHLERLRHLNKCGTWLIYWDIWRVSDVWHDSYMETWLVYGDMTHILTHDS